MIIRDLKVGDHFTQELRGEHVQFQVLSVETLGRQVQLELESRLGRGTARYMGQAFVPGTIKRTAQGHAIN